MKKLRRTKDDKVLAGVLGGFGKYFEIDSVLLRVIFIFVVLITGLFPGVIAYILAIFVMPVAGSEEPIVHVAHEETKHEETNPGDSNTNA